jgi:hypothetical protein
LSKISRKEQNAINVVTKSVRQSNGLAYTVNNQLIALLPESIVYYYFKTLMKAFKKDASIGQVNEICRSWHSKTIPTPSDSVLHYFLGICAHEFFHFWANHAEREERGEISQRKAEAEALEFERRVGEMLRFAVVGELVFQAEKAKLRESGVR